MNLAIDIGNSSTKIGVFKNDTLIIYKRLAVPGKFPWRAFALKNKIQNAIICSVSRNSGSEISTILKKHFNIITLSANTSIPIKNRYKSPDTLGKDRLAAAVGGFHLFPGKSVLVVQTGTCVTYDFINNKGQYPGGAISPGLKMRLNALHTFTGKLPLIRPQSISYRLGTTTSESILSGVVNGICDEIDAAINDYRRKNSDLKVILSGGDAVFFESLLKNEIFAQPNLVLYGLNEILRYNVESKS